MSKGKRRRIAQTFGDNWYSSPAARVRVDGYAAMALVRLGHQQCVVVIDEGTAAYGMADAPSYLEASHRLREQLLADAYPKLVTHRAVAALDALDIELPSAPRHMPDRKAPDIYPYRRRPPGSNHWLHERDEDDDDADDAPYD